MVAAEVIAIADDTATTSWRELPNTAWQQPDRRGVERGLGALPGQLRVGHSLRDEDGADGQAGEQVRA